MNLQWQKTAQQKGSGKKFGLVKSQGSNKKASIFGAVAETAESMSSAETMKRAMESARLRGEAKAAVAAKEALAQDASAFDYDGVYDSMEQEKTRRSNKGDTQTKTARYIPKLQEAAKIREVEFDRVYERQLLKEEEENKDLPQERYVTSAYKTQLMESRKWDAHDRAQADELEKQTTAETAGMHGFYANLLTKNIAVGADVDKSALSAYTHGSTSHKRMRDNTSAEPSRTAMKKPEERVGSSSPPKRGDTTTLSSEAKKQVGDTTLSSEAKKVVVAAPSAAPELETTESAPPTVSAVDAARERFLARKRARLTGGEDQQQQKTTTE